jgi:hypothetical protein
MKARRITHYKTKHLYVLSAILFLGIVGTYAYTFGTFSGGDDTLSSVSSGTAPEQANSPEPVDVEGAREIAQAQKPGVSVTKVEPVPVNGQITTYTVHFTDGTKVDIAAEDGAIVKNGGPETSSENTSSTSTSPTDTTVSTPGDTDTTQPPDEQTPPSPDEPPSPPPPTPEPTNP